MPAEESKSDKDRPTAQPQDQASVPGPSGGGGGKSGRGGKPDGDRPLRKGRSMRSARQAAAPLPPSGDAPSDRAASRSGGTSSRGPGALSRSGASRPQPAEPKSSKAERRPEPPRAAKRPASQRAETPELLEETDHTPLQNVPLLTRQLGRWTVEGYSRAAVQSYWRVSEMKIGFDAGAHPWDFMGLPRLFISHAHLDHISSLPAYVARRRMMKMEPPVIYLPKPAVDTTAALLRVFTQLDRGRMPCELVGLQPGDTVELTREYAVTATPTRHTVPSLGYIIWERRRKLKPEYQSLTGEQIRDIRLAGTEVSAEVRLPVVAYTGDTAPAGLDDSPSFYEAEVLITEMTFVSPAHRREKIHKHGHMHLDDIVARLDRFKNQYIVCGHFSTRYSDSRIHRWIRKSLPDLMGGRLIPWLDTAGP